MRTSIDKVFKDLETQGNQKRIDFNQKRGWTGPQYGLNLGQLRSYAKKHKQDHELACELVTSDNLDVLILSYMLMEPKQLSLPEIEAYLPSYPQLVDEYVHQVVSKTSHLKSLSLSWIYNQKENYRQAGWKGIVHLVEAHSLGEDELNELLDKIYIELSDAKGATQFNMNHALAQIGIENETLRSRARTIATELAVYKEMKVARGCTSPYAIEWIDVILKKRSE